MIIPQINIAMLIDCDNVSAKYIDSIINDLSKYGTINIRNAYGNWKDKRLQGWEDVLHQSNNLLIQKVRMPVIYQWLLILWICYIIKI